MAERPADWRRRLWTLVRLSITLGAITYVLSQITWRDRLLDAVDGQEVWGRLERQSNGAEVFRALDGQTFPVDDQRRELKFVPGFLTLIRDLNFSLFGLVTLVYPGLYLLMARRWQWLLRTHDLDPGFLETLRLTWIGILANNVLPSSTGGDVVKGFCIYRRSPGKRLAAVMTVFMDRVLGLISMMLIGSVAMLTQQARPEMASVSRYALNGLALVLMAGAAFFSGRLRRLFRVAEIVDRLPMKGAIRQIDESMFHYRGHVRALVGCVAISVIVHFYCFVCVYYLGRALNLNIALINYFMFLPLILTAGAMLPSIAGLGVLEGLFQYFFALKGVGATPSSAVALCILYRIVVLVSSIPGAWPTYREFGAKGIAKLSQATDEDEEEGESLAISGASADPATALSANPSSATSVHEAAVASDDPNVAVPNQSATAPPAQATTDAKAQPMKGNP